jgi:hypothetical protein
MHALPVSVITENDFQNGGRHMKNVVATGMLTKLPGVKRVGAFGFAAPVSSA